MIPPDQEIYEVEKRIAERRHRVEAAARTAGRQALRTLGSPWVLAGAAVFGFIAAGGVCREQGNGPVGLRGSQEKGEGGVLPSLLVGGAAGLVQGQFGSPLAVGGEFFS